MADDTVRLIHKAIDRCGDGDYAGALKLLDQAIKADPANAQAHFERGIALAELSRDREAVPRVTRVISAWLGMGCGFIFSHSSRNGRG